MVKRKKARALARTSSTTEGSVLAILEARIAVSVGSDGRIVASIADGPFEDASKRVEVTVFERDVIRSVDAVDSTVETVSEDLGETVSETRQALDALVAKGLVSRWDYVGAAHGSRTYHGSTLHRLTEAGRYALAEIEVRHVAVVGSETTQIVNSATIHDGLQAATAPGSESLERAADVEPVVVSLEGAEDKPVSVFRERAADVGSRLQSGERPPVMRSPEPVVFEPVALDVARVVAEDAGRVVATKGVPVRTDTKGFAKDVLAILTDMMPTTSQKVAFAIDVAADKGLQTRVSRVLSDFADRGVLVRERRSNEKSGAAPFVYELPDPSRPSPPQEVKTRLKRGKANVVEAEGARTGDHEAVPDATASILQTEAETVGTENERPLVLPSQAESSRESGQAETPHELESERFEHAGLQRVEPSHPHQAGPSFAEQAEHVGLDQVEPSYSEPADPLHAEHEFAHAEPSPAWHETVQTEQTKTSGAEQAEPSHSARAESDEPLHAGHEPVEVEPSNPDTDEPLHAGHEPVEAEPSRAEPDEPLHAEHEPVEAEPSRAEPDEFDAPADEVPMLDSAELNDASRDIVAPIVDEPVATSEGTSATLVAVDEVPPGEPLAFEAEAPVISPSAPTLDPSEEIPDEGRGVGGEAVPVSAGDTVMTGGATGLAGDGRIESNTMNPSSTGNADSLMVARVEASDEVAGEEAVLLPTGLDPISGRGRDTGHEPAPHADAVEEDAEPAVVPPEASPPAPAEPKPVRVSEAPSVVGPMTPDPIVSPVRPSPTKTGPIESSTIRVARAEDGTVKERHLAPLLVGTKKTEFYRERALRVADPLEHLRYPSSQTYVAPVVTRAPAFELPSKQAVLDVVSRYEAATREQVVNELAPAGARDAWKEGIGRLLEDMHASGQLWMKRLASTGEGPGPLGYAVRGSTQVRN